MKTTERTTLPINPHEQPIHKMEGNKLFIGVLITLMAVVSCFYWYAVWFIPLPDPVTKEEMFEVLTISSLIGSLCIAAVIISEVDIYFYEQYVERRPLLPFMKRRVVYYDKMHVHIMKDGGVILNHYKTPPKFLESPYTWFKANVFDFISLSSGSCPPEIWAFVKIKAQSVSRDKFLW